MSHFSMIEARPLPGKKSGSISWQSREGRSVIYQIVAILSALALVGLLVRNTLTNMRLRGIQSGYDFLLQPFGFDISETVIEYTYSSTYFVAFAIGMLNTLKVAVIGIALATALGFMLLFTFFTFTENVEILAYLMWPGVIVVGLAASQRFEKTQRTHFALT